MPVQMGKTVGGNDIQAFPISSASRCFAGSTSGASENGTWINVNAITCAADGEITITFPDGPKTLTVMEGWTRAFPFGVSIQIVSGNFDIAGE